MVKGYIYIYTWIKKRESLAINNHSSATFDGINFATAD